MAAEPLAGWEELFDELVELPEPERGRRLAEVRRDHGALAEHVERLLKADAASAGGFLDQPTISLRAAALFEEQVSEPAEPQLAPGSVIGVWRILGLLGQGGMGEVYLAERSDRAFAQRVALKIIKRGMDSQAIVRRFMRERQILARLDHPHLARFLDGGTAPDGRPYFALEWVDGEPITDYCRQHEMDLDARLRLMRTVCQAVDSAHRRLIVHRDLKPANILVTRDGTAKLLDFGIAKLLTGEEELPAMTLTRAGTRLLTPAYAAPEQILGEPVSTATDVYALGVLLYELITGRLPHRREQLPLASLASAVDQETAERPSAALRRPGADGRLARRVAGDLDLIVLKAMHRDPARRYSSAQALADDLERFLAGRPIRARPDELGYRVRKFLGRNRAAAAAAAVALLALLAALAVSLRETSLARAAAHRADREARRADSEVQRSERVQAFLISLFRQSDPVVGRGRQLSAKELLERGAAWAETQPGPPEAQADLLAAVAEAENNFGLAEPAYSHARRALDLRRAHLPPRDGRIGLALTTLGSVQDTRGDLAAARRSFEEALTLLVPAYGGGSVEVAAARRGLAETLMAPEEVERAVSLLREALASFVGHLGEGHVESAETLDELGVALERTQHYPEAEAAYRRAADLFTRSLGPQSVLLATTDVDLAGLLDRLGRPEEAKPLFARAIAIQRAELGARDPTLATTLFSNGILLLNEPQLDEAESALREALAIFGAGRLEGAHCLRYLGLLAMKRERYGAAADLFSRAADAYRRLEGDDGLQRWRALANLGWAHARDGRTAEGRQELTAAVASIERLTGAHGYELLQPLEELAEIEQADGRAEQAVAALRRERDLDRSLFRTLDRAAMARTDLLLAGALAAQGGAEAHAEARQLLTASLAPYAQRHPLDPLRADSLLLSGRLALSAGDREGARRDLAAALPLLAAERGASHPSTYEARRLLALAGG